MNVLDQVERQNLLKQIYSVGNMQRKLDAFKAYEILNDRHSKYVIEKMEEERGKDAGKLAKKFTSINLTPRMIDELASVYKDSPDRTFTEIENQEIVKDIYKDIRLDKNLKQANRYLKAMEQCEVQVLPKKGKLITRVLPPFLYDIIPDPMDPERPLGYIVSSYDSLSTALTAKDKHRFTWWTANYNFVTDGNGLYISTDINRPFIPGDNEILNPIGMLNFVSVKEDEGFNYWQRQKDSFVQFAVEFGALVSSVVDAAESQGFGIAVLAAEEKPEKIEYGIHKAVFLKLTRTADGDVIEPKFGFQNANPDLAAFIDLLEVILRFFLTSKGIDPKKISGKLEGQTFTSGVDRLLSMIQSFEASKDDFANFELIESEIYDIIKAWQSEASDQLDQKYRISIPEFSRVNVSFKMPEMIQTKSEKLDYIIKQKESGLMTIKESIQEIRQIDSDMAEAVLVEIQNERNNPIISSIVSNAMNQVPTENGEPSEESA